MSSPAWYFLLLISGRTPGKGKKAAAPEEEEDLTRDMEDPTPEPNVQEVHIPKSSVWLFLQDCFQVLNAADFWSSCCHREEC